MNFTEPDQIFNRAEDTTEILGLSFIEGMIALCIVFFAGMAYGFIIAIITIPIVWVVLITVKKVGPPFFYIAVTRFLIRRFYYKKMDLEVRS